MTTTLKQRELFAALILSNKLANHHTAHMPDDSRRSLTRSAVHWADLLIAALAESPDAPEATS